MGLRPGHCYSNIDKDRPYTRLAVTVPRKNFIGAAPGLKTRQFNMGNPGKQYTHILDLVVEDPIQIRDNAIESVRMTINRFLNNKIGKDNYFMKIRIFPFHIMRENKQAQGAHADRIQKGMSHAFGKPIGRAARVRQGQKLMSILVNEEHVEAAKKALLRAQAKMPAKLHVEIGTDVESIGTRPRAVKIIEEAVVETPKGEKKEGEAATAEAGKTPAGGKAPAAGKAEAKPAAGKTEAKKEEKKK